MECVHISSSEFLTMEYLGDLILSGGVVCVASVNVCI